MQISIQNEGATMPLIVPVLVLPNTPEEVGDAQIAANGRLALPWLDEVPAHEGVAVICGGGPSLEDTLPEVLELAEGGATVFGLNGASGWLSERGFWVDYQIMVDAKEESARLVDDLALDRLYASQVHPDTAARATMLFHLNNAGIEDLLPADRVAAGGYTLVGGGVSVGITALCVAYTLGFRKLHLFGYDSSNRGGATHAYSQQMNRFIPNIDVEWAGKVYNASMPMKLQAEAFRSFAEALAEEGCAVEVHGDGLLPAMWHLEPMTEREKYQKLWSDYRYRTLAPGETVVDRFLKVAKPEGLIIDFGCGTGRAALKLAEEGYEVFCVDFTDNCRDKPALALSFLQWDLTKPGLPVHAPYGFCTDVMEHIPTPDVPGVIDNIMGAAERVFFQIATVPDKFGATIGQKLHMTVKPHRWWTDLFRHLGYRIEWQEDGAIHSCFYVHRS